MTVIEIGPGPGGLTRALLDHGAARVIAVERDARAINADGHPVAPGEIAIGVIIAVPLLRVLLLAGLCAGATRIHDALDADDTRVMLAALKQLGCRVDAGDTSLTRCSSGSAAPIAAIG